MMGILQVKLVTVLVLLKLVSASVEIDKVQYYKSLTPQERQEIFNTDDVDHVPDFEIIRFNFPKLQKRSSDGIIPLVLPLLKKNINLKLEQAAPLIGPNTPVYSFRTKNRMVTSTKTFPFKDYTITVYEDENQLAALVVDIDAKGNKYVHSGVIGAHNISIHRAPNHQNPELQSCFIINLIDSFFSGGRKPKSFESPKNTPTKSSVKVPDVIYPEILVMVDASLYNKYTGFDSFKNYIINFWTTVNLKYKPLSKPKYKLSIAGIGVAEDRSAFEFIASHSSSTHLDYESALIGLQYWLYRNQYIIPIKSYDVAIVHTLLSSTSVGWFSTSREIGLASQRGACSVSSNERVTKVGIIYDDNSYKSIYTATHELGHTLGAGHDDDNTRCGGAQSIMSPFLASDAHLKYLEWSQCSINDLHDFLRTNPECLFNVPEPYQKKTQTPVTPPPEVIIEINNRIDNSTKNKEYAIYEKGSDWGKTDSIIPERVRDIVVDNTDIKYSELDYIVPEHQYSVMSDFMTAQYDPQKIPSNKIVEILIVGRNRVYVFFLDRKIKNSTTSELNGRLGKSDLLLKNKNVTKSQAFISRTGAS